MESNPLKALFTLPTSFEDQGRSLTKTLLEQAKESVAAHARADDHGRAVGFAGCGGHWV
jgi:hypothetical protein